MALVAGGALAIGYLSLFPASAQEAQPTESSSSKYAIIVKDSTYKNPKWRKVVDALDERHHAEVFRYQDQPEEVLPKLREYKPKDMAVVGTPEDVGIPELPDPSNIDAVRMAARATIPLRVASMANQIDDDDRRDVRFGIVTGYTSDDALRIATTHNFAIENALMKADEGYLSAFPNGVAYSEDEKKDVVVKKTKVGKDISRTTMKLVSEDIFNTINTDDVQLICTTGHANYNQWKISYNNERPDKWAFSQDGDIYLVDENTGESSGSISSSNPKVIVANGNCREGGFPNRNAIFLSWMHSGGAVQCFGYVTETWYGATGWAINEHMFNNPGISWSEAHRMAELGLQSRLNRLLKARGSGDRLDLGLDGDKHLYGHAYDADVLTFYGDPGTQITINFDPSWTPLYRKSIATRTAGEKEIHNFSVHINSDGITKPIVFPVEEDFTQATITTNPADLYTEVIDDAVIMDPAWQIVRKEDGQLVIRNREIRPGDDFSVELSVTR